MCGPLSIYSLYENVLGTHCPPKALFEIIQWINMAMPVAKRVRTIVFLTIIETFVTNNGCIAVPTGNKYLMAYVL
jgi:hypothetical protein